jgi:hypothetical protein
MQRGIEWRIIKYSFAIFSNAQCQSQAQSVRLLRVSLYATFTRYDAIQISSALRGLSSSGVSVQAIQNSGEDTVDDAHSKALAPFHQFGGSYRIGASFRGLLARP